MLFSWLTPREQPQVPILIEVSNQAISSISVLFLRRVIRAIVKKTKQAAAHGLPHRVSVPGGAARSPSSGALCCRRDQIRNHHGALSLLPLEGPPPATAAWLSAPALVTAQRSRRPCRLRRPLRLRPSSSLRPPSPPARPIQLFKDASPPRASSRARPRGRPVCLLCQPSPSSLSAPPPAGRRRPPASSARHQAPNRPGLIWVGGLCPRRRSHICVLKTLSWRCRRPLTGHRQRCPAWTAAGRLMPC